MTYERSACRTGDNCVHCGYEHRDHSIATGKCPPGSNINQRKDTAAVKAFKVGFATNPKDALGTAKVPLSAVPPAAIIHTANAFRDGDAKYGPYNWRQNRVKASIYVDAALRHILSWFDGEDHASDSGVHHLGHAMACLAILLDAYEAGALEDNRPPPGQTTNLLRNLSEKYVAKKVEEEMFNDLADEIPF